MKRAIIFANGKLEVSPYIISQLKSADLIIAADGGSKHCQSLGIIPNVIIGDFDSLDPQDISTYQKAGVDLLQYPTSKDETDLELALQLALQHQIDRVDILGALGDRWDMTLANVLLAILPKFSHLAIRLLDGKQELLVLRGDGEFDIKGDPRSIISLIPIAGDASGVTTQGLEYSLYDETLYQGSPRGVSNKFLQDHARVSIRHGSLLCCIMKNGEN